MVQLVAHVGGGGMPAPAAPSIMCRAGEVQFGALQADVQVHCGMDVEYSGSSWASGGLLFTAAAMATAAAVHANQRRKAEAQSRPQWRPVGNFPVIVTNQRVLLMTEQWTSYYLQHLIMIEPHPLNYSVSLHFEGSYPVMLHGPWVPWATVAIGAALFRQPWPPSFQAPPELRPPAVRTRPGQPLPAGRTERQPLAGQATVNQAALPAAYRQAAPNGGR